MVVRHDVDEVSNCGDHKTGARTLLIIGNVPGHPKHARQALPHDLLILSGPAAAVAESCNGRSHRAERGYAAGGVFKPEIGVGVPVEGVAIFAEGVAVPTEGVSVSRDVAATSTVAVGTGSSGGKLF